MQETMLKLDVLKTQVTNSEPTAALIPCQALPSHFQRALICFVTPNEAASMYKDAVQLLVSDAHPSLG